MMSVTSTPPTGGINNQQLNKGPATVQASAGPQVFLWCPTAMRLSGQSNAFTDSVRTRTTCYMKGLSEHLRISTTTGLPWFHRRICFTSKLTFLPTFNAGATLPRNVFNDSDPGVTRLWFNMSRNNDSADFTTFYGFLFRGEENKDWTDPIVAPTDPLRITVKYDKTWTYKSGNTVGTVKETKLWHGMNHNIVYDDDEDAYDKSTRYFSTSSKAGMGNYFVVDIFSALDGGATTDLLRVDANSTLYWHER